MGAGEMLHSGLESSEAGARLKILKVFEFSNDKFVLWIWDRQLNCLLNLELRMFFVIKTYKFGGL